MYALCVRLGWGWETEEGGVFIQQCDHLGVEAVGQSMGSGVDGSISSPRGQQVEQVMCWV